MTRALAMTVLTEGLVFGAGSSLHCVAMCGPLLLSSAGERSALFGYHGMRMLSYASVGGLLGVLGAKSHVGFLRESAPWVGIALALGLLLATLGIDRLFGAIPAAGRLLRTVLGGTRSWSPTLRTAALGAVTPLLPCGVLWILFGTALLSGSAAAGASATLGFALGSTPLLLLTHWHAGWLRRRVPAARLRWLSRSVIVFAASLLLWRSASAMQGGSCCH